MTRNVPPMIPLEIADLTAEFFEEAFQARVDATVLVDHNTGTTGRARFRLSGDATLPGLFS